MIATRDRHFDTTYLTPTDGLQDAVVGLESWGSLDSKPLIKLEKTREESKSSAAGERKGPMLKSKSLESICWPVWFLYDARCVPVGMRRPREYSSPEVLWVLGSISDEQHITWTPTVWHGRQQP